MNKKILALSALAFLITACIQTPAPQQVIEKTVTIIEPPVITPFSYKGSVWFANNSHKLSYKSSQKLDNLVSEMLSANSRGAITDDTQVVIVGHTDSNGSINYNQKLSEKRAKTVAKYLKAGGIDLEMMFAFGRSEFNPVATNGTREGRKMNRRVIINVGQNLISVSYD